MKKKEFIEKLSLRLNMIDENEKENILNYYDEFISDKMEEQDEEEIIAELGSIDDIIKKLNFDSDKKIKYDSLIAEKKNKPIDTKILILIIVILSFPIWFSALMSIFGIFMGFCAVVLSFVLVGFVFVISGSIGAIVSLFMINTNLEAALAQLGLCIVLIGIGLIIIPLSICFSRKCYEVISNFVKYVIKRGKSYYEQEAY